MLETIINNKLNITQFHDCVPNGLQIEGCSNITKIITGVTACQKLLDYAIQKKANGIIVHHGYFWKNEPKIIHGMKKNRLKAILSNNINLFSWHLPLDYHLELGNNIQIAKKLDIKVKGLLSKHLFWGYFVPELNVSDLIKKISLTFGREPLHCNAKNKNKISSIAWCSGKGQSLIYDAASHNIDSFITGEISEDTVHCARENNMHFFSIGHHASELFGIQALTNWLIKKYNLDCTFINIENFA